MLKNRQIGGGWGVPRQSPGHLLVVLRVLVIDWKNDYTDDDTDEILQYVK